jgi:hypothetical protein
VGDSISHTNGFHDPEGKLWLDVFASRHNITNLSIGGQSNQKIFFKIAKELILNDFDFIIVQWGYLLRLTLNCNNSIYDNTMTMAPKWYSHAMVEPIYNSWHNNFLHSRIAIEELLICITETAETIIKKNIPFIFIKGFENYFSDLQKENWQDCSEKYQTRVLFQQQLPDWEIKKYHLEMRLLYLQMKNISGRNWLNLDQLSWMDQRIDYADDGTHPGIESSKKFGNDVVEFAKTLDINL